MHKRYVVMLAAGVFWAPVAYGASLGDMFGGKKAQEYKVMLDQKEQECQAKLGEKDAALALVNEASREARDAAENYQTKNATLMEAYEKLKTDQESMLKQFNRLRRESLQCDEIKATYNQMSAQNETFLQEREALEQKAKALNVVIENLKKHVKEVSAEKDRLAVFLAEAQESEDVKIKKIRDGVTVEMEGLKQQVSALSKDNAELTKVAALADQNKRLIESGNKDLLGKIDLLEDEIKAMEQQQTELKMENRSLARESTQFPKKFADLARHNRKLVKETADMHYNLGVSHIKNKDYTRAIKEFEKVLELKPDDAYANYNLGYIYAEHLVDRERAMKYFQDYLAYAPDAKDADWVRKYMLTWQTWYGKQTSQ